MDNYSIAANAVNFLYSRLAEQCYLDDNGAQGGELRTFSGETVELMTGQIWNDLVSKPEYNGGYFEVGKKDPFMVGDYDCEIPVSVDLHCYANDNSNWSRLITVIECKTYLDRPFLERANIDFMLIKRNLNAAPVTKTVLISLEDNIAENAMRFWMNEGNIDYVFFLASGKRISTPSERIYRHPERIDSELMVTLVDSLDSILQENLSHMSLFGDGSELDQL